MDKRYMVTRSQSKDKTPCGMNGILYYGKSERMALNVFNRNEGGKDNWGKDDKSFGLIVYSFIKYSGSDVILGAKGF